MSEVQISETAAKWLAEHSIEGLKRGRDVIIDQHADSFKWILASLLTINSGGAISLLSSSSLSPDVKVESGSFFILGIMTAILIAVISQKLSQRAFPIINSQIGLWLSVLEDGMIPNNLEEVENLNSIEMRRFQWIIPAVGWVSAICFLCGVISIGNGLGPDTMQNKATESKNSVVIQPEKR
jgi:hypothetical protein